MHSNGLAGRRDEAQSKKRSAASKSAFVAILAPSNDRPGLDVLDGESMRTIADAVEALAEAQYLLHNSFARIMAVEIGLPDGRRSWSISVIADRVVDRRRKGVRLPLSYTFVGRNAAGNNETVEAGRLHDAVVSFDGTVELADGVQLTALEAKRCSVTRELTQVQKLIVYRVCKFLNFEDVGYRMFPDAPPLPLTPDLRFLDHSKLHGRKMEKLESLLADVQAMEPTLRRVVRQTVANALRACGLRPHQNDSKKYSATIQLAD